MPNHVHGVIELVGKPDETTTRSTVGQIVGAYKSLCVKHCLGYIKQHSPKMILGQLWQRNYYEHIIRNEKSYLEIAEYILNNPMKWAEDKFYINAPSPLL